VAGCFCTGLNFWKIPQIFLIQKNLATNVGNPIDSAHFLGVVLFLQHLLATGMLVRLGMSQKTVMTAVPVCSAGWLDMGT